MDFKKCLLFGMSISGTVVGVGFASGREVVTFFARFGWWSLLFCLLAGILFGFFSYGIFSLQNSFGFSKADNVGSTQPSKFDSLFSIVIFICQVAISAVMIAGIDNVLTMLGISETYVIVFKIFILIICVVYLLLFNKGVYFINSVLTILMLIAILITFVMTLQKGFTFSFSSFNGGLLYLPLLYVGMNVLTAFPLLSEISEKLNKRERVLSSVMIGVFISIPLLLVCSILLFSGPEFFVEELVMVAISGSLSTTLMIIYTILIALSLVTTLLSTCYGASKYVLKAHPKLSIVFVMILAFCLSFIGFSNIIDKLYPIIGFVCVVVVTSKLSKRRIKSHRKADNKSE